MDEPDWLLQRRACSCVCCPLRIALSAPAARCLHSPSRAPRVTPVAAQARRYYKSHPSTTGQLTAGQFGGAIGYPRPSVTSNEDPLIKEKMRTFPDNHPSFGSVPNLKAMGAPALVFTQGDSTQWESTTRATIDLHKPTLKNRKEGKASVEALFGAGDLYTVPIDSYVAPVGAPPTISRDQRVFKHMGTLSRLGKW